MFTIKKNTSETFFLIFTFPSAKNNLPPKQGYTDPLVFQNASMDSTMYCPL